MEVLNRHYLPRREEIPHLLVVLLGAGASHDCLSHEMMATNPPLRPPLVTGLFGLHPAVRNILHAYPLAEAAAADIRPAIASGAVAIEEYLRDHLRDSPDIYARRRFTAIPLYLQQVLWTASRDDGRGFTRHPDNYDRLINASVSNREVIFITLNYDTILDGRLAIYHRIDSLDDYVANGEPWSLIKLHGSVNWGYPVHAPGWNHTLIAQLVDEGFSPEPTPVLLNPGSIDSLRSDGSGTLFYPALSAPLGAADEVICPPEHLRFFRHAVDAAKRVDLVVIGYSGLDKEALTLLSHMGPNLGKIHIVNGSQEAGEAAGARIAEALRIEFLGQMVFPGGFRDFVARDDFLPALD